MGSCVLSIPGPALCATKEAKDKGVNFFDSGHENEIKMRAQPRLDSWAIQFKSPTAALAKALEGLEQGESVPSVASDR